MRNDLPNLGVGLAYRPGIHAQIIANADSIDWFEVITDSYLDRVHALLRLSEIVANKTIVLHGLEMSIGSESPLNEEYIDAVARIAHAVNAPWVSDHLCFTREGEVDLQFLAPIVRTRERARHIAARARYIQERIERPFILENIAYYIDLKGELTEVDFISEVLEQSKCGMLLDLNNVAINAANHAFDAKEYIDALPLDRVVQVHLAGNSKAAELNGVLIDGHDGPISQDVFELLAHLLTRSSPCGVVIERDQNFPEDFQDIVMELNEVRSHLAARRV